MTEGIRFCEGCPFVPEGVVAEIKHVRMPSDLHARQMMATRLAEMHPGSYIEAMGSATITSVAVEASPESGVDVGDEAELEVWAGGKDEAWVKERVHTCPHPKLGRLAKALGSRGTCQALQTL